MREDGSVGRRAGASTTFYPCASPNTPFASPEKPHLLWGRLRVQRRLEIGLEVRLQIPGLHCILSHEVAKGTPLDDVPVTCSLGVTGMRDLFGGDELYSRQE